MDQQVMGMGMVQVRVLTCLIMMERNTGSDLVSIICTYQDKFKNSVSLNFKFSYFLSTVSRPFRANKIGVKNIL